MTSQLRPTDSAPPVSPEIHALSFDDEVYVDLRAAAMRRGTESVPLTATEVSLLLHLAQHPGRWVPKEELLIGVWGYPDGSESRAVDNALLRLRRKMRAYGGNGYVLSRYGHGLMLHRCTVLTEGALPPTPDPGGLWSAAMDLAIARGDGFLGFEHLLFAAAELPLGTPMGLWFQRLGRTRGPAWMAAVDALTPTRPAAQPPGATPRLQGLPTRDVDALLTALFVDRGLDGWLRARLPADGPETEALARPGDGTPTRLEVVGGPEDGLELPFQAGARVGRYADGDGLELGLQRETALVDRQLSREALTWIAPDRVRLGRAAARLGATWEPLEPGEHTVDVGTQLRLGASTVIGFRADRRLSCD